MCLSAEALALFLNILAHDIVATEPGRVTVRAEAGDVHWVAVEDRWCTRAPERDRKARLSRPAR